MATKKVIKKATKKYYIMSPSELMSLRQEMKDTEGVLKQAESYGQGTRASEMLDKNELKRSVNRYDSLIKKHSPKEIKGASKDKMVKRAKELGEFIQEGMPSYDEMMDIGRNPGTPWKNLKWEKEKASAINEWKQCQRRLEPGDPTASVVERLRSRQHGR